VTSYLEKTKPYLDLCIDSIKNLDYPKDRLEVFIVSPKWYWPRYEGVHTIHPRREAYFNAHALNYGASKADQETQYFLFCNDDVIFTKDSLTGLLVSSQSLGDHGVFMPIGNDQQQRYMWAIPGVNVGPYRLENLGETVHQLKNCASPYNRGLIFCETLCLYAVLVPRPVWDLVGEYDDSRSGQDDVDYTRRVARAGLVNAICMNSLVYHAGGVSADLTLGALNSQERANSLKSYNEKWETNV
jgi:GT2 family glycosyltransferase